MRYTAAEAWGLLDDLLADAEACGDAVVQPPLLEAEATVLRLVRVLTRPRRRAARRETVWFDDVAMVRQRLDEIAAHTARAPLVRDREVVVLLEAALASLARLDALVAERRR